MGGSRLLGCVLVAFGRFGARSQGLRSVETRHPLFEAPPPATIVQWVAVHKDRLRLRVQHRDAVVVS